MNEVQVQSTPNGIVFHPKPESKNFQDLTGMRSHFLTVIGKCGFKSSTGKYPYWWCQCDCGVVKMVSSGSIKSGDTKSCGCKYKQLQSDAHTSHGFSRHPLRKVWEGMIDRCSKPNHSSYKNYGARGISVCDRWIGENGFTRFISDMGDRPSASHSIERVNNSMGYFPDNCKWATMKEQARNTRYNRIVKYNGESMCVSELAERTGVKRSLIFSRLRRGWSVSDCVLIPDGMKRDSEQ